MEVFRGPTSFSLAADLFGVITAMDEGRGNQYVEELVTRTWQTSLERINFYASSNLMPAQCIFQTPAYLIVVNTGVRSGLHIGNVMSSVMNPLQRSLSPEAPDYTTLAADTINARMQSDGFEFEGRRLIVFGHSYGGAIALRYHNLVRRAGYANDAWCIAVAPPRVVTRATIRSYSDANCCCYQNFQDPVPFVMPHTDEAPMAVRALYTPQAWFLADSFFQPGQWRVFGADGYGCEFATGPTPPRGTVLLGTLEWAFTLDRFSSPTHARPTYEQLFQQNLATQLGVAPRVYDGGFTGVGGDSPPGDWGGNSIPVTPPVNLIQGMTVSLPPSQNVINTLQAGRSSKGKKLDVNVEGYIVGQHRSGGLRRKVRARAKSLRRLCEKLDVFHKADMMSYVQTWRERQPSP